MPGHHRLYIHNYIDYIGCMCIYRLYVRTYIDNIGCMCIYRLYVRTYIDNIGCMYIYRLYRLYNIIVLNTYYMLISKISCTHARCSNLTLIRIAKDWSVSHSMYLILMSLI